MSQHEFRTKATGFRPARKIRTALRGIRSAMLLDFSVLYKVIVSGVFLAIAALFETLFHFLFVLAVTGLMLIAEVFNTAVEAVCDYIEPGHDDRIKTIKEIAAGAAMVAIAIWYVVLVVVLVELLTMTGRAIAARP